MQHAEHVPAFLLFPAALKTWIPVGSSFLLGACAESGTDCALTKLRTPFGTLPYCRVYGPFFDLNDSPAAPTICSPPVVIALVTAVSKVLGCFYCT